MTNPAELSSSRILPQNLEAERKEETPSNSDTVSEVFLQAVEKGYVNVNRGSGPRPRDDYRRQGTPFTSKDIHQGSQGKVNPFERDKPSKKTDKVKEACTERALVPRDSSRLPQSSPESYLRNNYFGYVISSEFLEKIINEYSQSVYKTSYKSGESTRIMPLLKSPLLSINSNSPLNVSTASSYGALVPRDPSRLPQPTPKPTFYASSATSKATLELIEEEPVESSRNSFSSKSLKDLPSKPLTIQGLIQKGSYLQAIKKAWNDSSWFSVFWNVPTTVLFCATHRCKSLLGYN